MPDDDLVGMVVSKYPEYAAQIHDVDVATLARASLAKRGLTPEAVKANPDIGISSPDDFTVAEPKTVGGGFGGGLGDSLNPAELWRSAMSGLDSALDSAQQFTVMGNREPTLRDVGNAVNPIVPVLAIPDAYAEATRRGEANESTADMYGNAAGTALLAAAGHVAPKIIGRGPAIVADAETAYKNAISTPATEPLTETMASKMMKRKIIMDDPAAIAKRADALSENLTTARDNIPKPKVTLGQPLSDEASSVIGKRAALADEASFQSNLSEIAKAMPDKKTIRNVITEARNASVVEGVAAGLGWHTPAIAGGVITGAKLLYELPKTSAFKTALPIAKKMFGQALAAGDPEAAARIGARIAAGELTAQNFGHQQAVQQLQNEVSQYQEPALRRMVVGMKKGYYEDPSGVRTPIPQGVMTAFMDAKNLTDTDSPVQQWLSAMERQKKIKGGGHLAFVGAGDSDTSDAAAPAPFARLKDQYKDFPADPNALDENDAMFMRRKRYGKDLKFPGPSVSPTSLLPEHFKVARMVTLGTPLTGAVDNPLKNGSTAHGLFGSDFSTGTIKRQRTPANQILIDAKSIDTPQVYAHELNHAIYQFDISPKERETFQKMVNKVVQDFMHDAQAARSATGQPSLDENALKQVSERYPKSILGPFGSYTKDRARVYHESFAEMGGQYMLNPRAFKEKFPGFYDYFRNVYRGKEYVGGDAVTAQGNDRNGTMRRFGGNDEFNGPYSKSENEDLIRLLAPATYLPARFEHARSAKIGTLLKAGSRNDSLFATESGRLIHEREPDTGNYWSELRKALSPAEWKKAMEGKAPTGYWQGVYGQPFNGEPEQTEKEFGSNPKYNTVLMARGTPDFAYPAVLIHELGHAVWFNNDITDKEKADWAELHNRLRTLDKGVPEAIKWTYRGAPDHSFAELFGHYVANPTQMKSDYPVVFSYFRKLFGRDYITLSQSEASELEARRK
jgi:hypothetical protein